MDRSALAARIQEILKSRPLPTAPRQAGDDEEAAFAARCAAAEASSRVSDVLGATTLDGAHGPCVVVDRHYPASHPHGRHVIERYLTAARSSLDAVPWFLDRAGPRPAGEGSGAAPRLLCFDLETTGLSGGAGTYVFLVGFGFFDNDGFRTRQFFLRGFGEERALLHAVTEEVASCRTAGAPVLVTYNGRAFDVPLIETRYQMHRLRSPFGLMPHVDMLFPARRLWKRRALHRQAPVEPSAFGRRGRAFVAAVPDESPGSCALTAIERDILGLNRQDDVPGWEIPSRYFGYTRTGDASGLAAVLEHNRLDLISLAAVAAVILEMVEEGVGVARERQDDLALGWLFESLDRIEDAEHCFAAAAVDDGMLDLDLDRMVRADALHWLALHRRRFRRFEEAADAWRRLAEIPGVDIELRREALEALAIHHEHRVKDLARARAFALSALQLSDDARRVDEVRHRLGRLSKKIDAGRDGLDS